MFEQPVIKFLVNNKLSINLNVSWKILGERSTLFQGIIESCDLENQNQVVNLQLERPEKFSILLHYIETGIIAEELYTCGTFVSYINDIIYLGLDELEILVKQLLTQCIKMDKINEIDFTQSHPRFDFIERFFQENGRIINGCEFQLCALAMKWLEKSQCCQLEMKDLVGECVKFENLQLEQIKLLQRQFPKLFDLIFPASFLISQYMEMTSCRWCGKSIFKIAIGREECSKGAFHQ